MTNSVPHVELNSGTSIPQLGFGVFLVEPGDAQRVVEEALEAGYRHIDTATAYANEAEVGAAITASGIPREELFITTKLFNPDHKGRNVVGAFARSLELLDLDYVDLYLIHWPMPANRLFVETWRTFETFFAEGRSKAIGVSNFLIRHLEELIAETDVVPAVNQIELHPAFQQAELRAFHAEHGIRTEAWGPLGQGKYDVFGLPAIAAAARAHGVTPAQVVLRWHIQIGNIVIPKSSSRERMAENFDLFGFELDADELTAIAARDKNMRVSRDPAEVN